MATNVACVALCHAALWSSSRMCTCKCVRIWKNQCLACRGISLIQPQINPYSVLFYLWRLQVWISQKLIDSLKNPQETIHVAMPPSFLWRHGERAVKSLVFPSAMICLEVVGWKKRGRTPWNQLWQRLLRTWVTILNPWTSLIWNLGRFKLEIKKLMLMPWGSEGSQVPSSSQCTTSRCGAVFWHYLLEAKWFQDQWIWEMCVVSPVYVCIYTYIYIFFILYTCIYIHT